MYRILVKPVCDFIFATSVLIVASPIITLATIFLYIANDGKPFFFQLRPGKNGKIFKIYKFKTMNDAKDHLGNLLSDEVRLTKIGAIVRKTSIDELPQLFNIIMGQMSLIGPRPLLPEYLQLFNNFEKKRHDVKPGITGLTAVNGRNNIPWNIKMEYDVYYTKNVTFFMDIKIFFKTFIKIIKSDGVNKEGFISTDSFNDYCLKNPNRNYNDC